MTDTPFAAHPRTRPRRTHRARHRSDGRDPLLAHRVGRTRLDRRRVLALRPDQGRGLARVTTARSLLFKEEYKLPLIDPTLAAYLAAVAEHVFPVLLVIGLGDTVFRAGASWS